jgi:hypothetical protein
MIGSEDAPSRCPVPVILTTPGGTTVREIRGTPLAGTPGNAGDEVRDESVERERLLSPFQHSCKYIFINLCSILFFYVILIFLEEFRPQIFRF